MSAYNSFASHFLMNIDKYENRKYLNDDRKFTRKGKISYRDTILYPLLQEGRTNSREANEYMRLITGGYVCDDITTSDWRKKRVY